MEKGILLARANMRRARGQTAAILVLILLASLMLNLWLMLSLDYKRNFDRCHERLNAGHVTLAVDGDGTKLREFFARTLEDDARTDGYSLTDCLHMAGQFAYNGGEVNSELVFLEKEAALERPVGRDEIVEESPYTSGVYMPVLYRCEAIDIGKTIEISVGSQTMSYTICGFFNSAMAGSHNCMMCEILLSADCYEELRKSGCAPEATLCSIRLSDPAESESYETTMKNLVSSYFPTARAVSNSYALVSQSRYISQMICAGVLSAMAFLILLIALVVIGANIANFVEENMKNLGALKAIGYTGRQLTGFLHVQFLGLSLLSGVAGAGLSYLLFPALNAMMVSQTGIPYRVRFLPAPFLLTLAILGGAVAAAVRLSSRRLRRIEPIAALRQGVATHNFRRNPAPLSKTWLALTPALAWKTASFGIRQNVAVAITMLSLSLVLTFSGVMAENMIADIKPFIDMIVGETADSCINVNAAAEEAFVREMEADGRVEKTYLYTTTEVRHVGGIGLMATVCDDFSRVNNPGVVFAGRFPQFDNEIAVAGKYAEERGLQIGDEIVVTAEGKEAAYLITGFTQMSNNLGKDCLLTREGFERMGALFNASYYLNLEESADIDAFNEEMKERLGSEANAALNIEAMIEGSASEYISLMKAIVAGILLLSGIIVTFVLYLLVRTALNRKKREYGILKALGFTTGQLVLQTALSFMPALVLSTAAGLTVCSGVINPLMALFLRGIGIVKCTFTVPYGRIALFGGALVLFAFAVLCLLSLNIRRIAPRGLLAGE